MRLKTRLLSILFIVSIFFLGSCQAISADSAIEQSNPNREVLTSESVPAQVIDAVRQDLSNRTRIAANKFKMVKASQKTWSDGCLELAQPDELCTQALVEGWQIVMSYGDRSWIYRTDAQGNTVRLETETEE